MDFISPDGKSSWPLDALLKRSGGHMKPRGAARVLCKVAEAIAYAHDRGVVHCDIKPGNILVAGNNDVRVSDFGLSKVVGRVYLDKSIKASISGSLGIQDTQVPGKRTASPNDSLGFQDTLNGGENEKGGSLVGTFHYMPPEVQEGGEWTPRGDLYSIGVLSYVLLTGKRPVGRWKAPSKSVDGLSPAWDDLVETLLAEDPAERPENAKELLGIVKRITKPAHSDYISAPSGVDEKEPENRVRRSYAKIIVAGAAVVIGGFALVQYGLPSEKQTIAEVPVAHETPGPVAPVQDSGIPQNNLEKTDGNKQEIPEVSSASETASPVAPVQVQGTRQNTLEKNDKTQTDPAEPELLQAKDLPQEQESLESASDISEIDMRQMDYWAGIAEAQYVAVEAWKNRLRKGSGKWNERVNETITIAQQSADEAQKAWLEIQKKYNSEQTDEEVESAWLGFIERARLARLQAESLQEGQKKADDYTTYLELNAQQKELRAQADAEKLMLEQQRRMGYHQQMELFRAEDAVRYENLRRSSGK